MLLFISLHLLLSLCLHNHTRVLSCLIQSISAAQALPLAVSHNQTPPLAVIHNQAPPLAVFQEHKQPSLKNMFTKLFIFIDFMLSLKILTIYSNFIAYY